MPVILFVPTLCTKLWHHEMGSISMSDEVLIPANFSYLQQTAQFPAIPTDDMSKILRWRQITMQWMEVINLNDRHRTHKITLLFLYILVFHLPSRFYWNSAPLWSVFTALIDETRLAVNRVKPWLLHTMQCIHCNVDVDVDCRACKIGCLVVHSMILTQYEYDFSVSLCPNISSWELQTVVGFWIWTLDPGLMSKPGLSPHRDPGLGDMRCIAVRDLHRTGGKIKFSGIRIYLCVQWPFQVFVKESEKLWVLSRVGLFLFEFLSSLLLVPRWCQKLFDFFKGKQELWARSKQASTNGANSYFNHPGRV